MRMTAPPEWWAAPWPAGTSQDPDAGWDDDDAGAAPAGTTPGSWWQAAHDEQDVYRAILAPIEQDLDQVRSRDRVRNLAEVFTHQREIDAMLDQIPDAFSGLDVTFLEPACGSGNFLTAVLRRKLRLVAKADSVSQEQYEHRLLRGIASIYGIDISPENITEARSRMAHVVLEHYQSDANTIKPTAGFLNAAGLMLGDNIVVGDTLNADHAIELCEWRPHAGARFERVWSFALIPERERDLFWHERHQDAEPVHYAALEAPPTPTRPARGKPSKR